MGCQQKMQCWMWNAQVHITELQKSPYNTLHASCMSPKLVKKNSNRLDVRWSQWVALYKVHICVFTWSFCSPPPVDPNVGRSREPGVEDVDAADSIRSQQRFLQRRVVVEPQALPEPVDRINDHYSTGRVLFVPFWMLRSPLVLTPLWIRLTQR